MAPTWTEEQTRKLAAACEEASKSGAIAGSDEYWEYVVKKVGDGKTVKDCKEEYERTYLMRLPTTWTQEEMTKVMVAIETGDKNLERLASTWSTEEIRKFKVAFVAGDKKLDTTNFWDYMAMEIGGTKTVADCKELFTKASIRAFMGDMPKNKK